MSKDTYSDDDKGLKTVIDGPSCCLEVGLLRGQEPENDVLFGKRAASVHKGRNLVRF